MSLMAVLWLASLASPVAPAPRPAKVKIVSTLTDLRAIAQAVGGDLVECSALCAGKQDPHFVDPKPSFLVRLRDADLFMVNGLDLEIGWVPPLLDGARNPRILPGGPGYVNASKAISALDIPPAGTTRAEGDVHPFGNPHYLLDPLNGLEVARTIASKLREIRPQEEEAIARRLLQFETRLHESLFGKDLVAQVGGEKLERLAKHGELDAFLAGNEIEGKPLETRLQGWMGKLRILRGAKVVAYHRTVSYLAHRFGFEILATVEPKPGIPPSPSYIASLVERMKSERVVHVLTHSFYDEQVPGRLAEMTGARVVVLPAAVEGVPEARDYIQLFDAIVARLTGQGP